jgi:hypothetical protein
MPSISKQTIKQKLLLPEPVWLQNTYKLLNNEKKMGPDLGDFGLFSDPTKMLCVLLSQPPTPPPSTHTAHTAHTAGHQMKAAFGTLACFGTQ